MGGAYYRDWSWRPPVSATDSSRFPDGDLAVRPLIGLDSIRLPQDVGDTFPRLSS